MQHVHDFGVDHGAVDTEDLGVDLVKLAIAPLLGAFVPEHGTDRIELLQDGIGVELVLHERANDRCGRFRAQGEPVAVAVFESVHLFLDYIRALADTARKQVQFLHNRSPNFVIPEILEHLACGALHHVPPDDLVGQYVIHASYGLNTFHFSPGYCVIIFRTIKDF